MKVGDLVTEHKSWRRSIRCSLVSNVRVDLKTENHKYELVLSGVRPKTNNFTPEKGVKEIETVFKNVHKNNSWQDHVTHVRPSFVYIITDVIYYKNTKRPRFVKVMHPAKLNEEVWLHANDLQLA